MSDQWFRAPTDANEPINPTGDHHDYQPSCGLTKRELLAAMAMQGLLASPYEKHEVNDGCQAIHIERVASMAVSCADELVKCLNTERIGK